jgi:hypothetical protein
VLRSVPLENRGVIAFARFICNLKKVRSWKNDTAVEAFGILSVLPARNSVQKNQQLTSARRMEHNLQRHLVGR